MMALPQWIEDAKCANYFQERCGKCQFARALEILWAYAEKQSNEDYRGNKPNHINEASQAMKKIEELPNEKRERFHRP